MLEDDVETAAYLRKGLEQHGHTIDLATSGRDGLFLAAAGGHDVMIVDRMLPDLDGLGVVKTVRSAGVKTPILFLTTMGGVGDRVEGLEAGGDDYLIKPFAFVELLARLNALTRRPPMALVETVLKVADLEMDLLGRTVRRAGQEIDVQPREFRLLEYLMRNAGRLVTNNGCSRMSGTFIRSQDQHRRNPHKPAALQGGQGLRRRLIKTVRGSGYFLRVPT